MPPEPTHPYTVLNVFTDTPLQGNQLAVFTDGEEIPSRLMQPTARELNLSETVFVLPDDEADAWIRIFTPGAELPFAGHPTLGSAFVVGERDNLDVVRLKTGAGIVPVVLTRRNGEIVFGEMEQPIPAIEPFAHEAELLAALGVRSAVLPVEQYTNGPVHLMVTLGSAGEVAGLTPDFRALTALGEYCFSCFAADGANVKTRMFAPGAGVAEDPATGSAAGPLALHLVRHGRASYGETLAITQGVEIRRPSTLHARIDGSGAEIVRIAVGGSAVTVAHGHYRLQ
jgi:trans-2,3-dihydro-3-hydroxyanthranilate isomerase